MKLMESLKTQEHKYRSFITDPENLRLTGERLLQASLLNDSVEPLQDRRREVLYFYGIPAEELDGIIREMKAGDVSQGDRADEVFYSDEALFDHYRQNNLRSAVAGMCLDTSVYESGFCLIQYLNSFYPRKMRDRVTVLDYGCGMADLAIAFASQGYRVRIADISGGPIDFARWRLEERGYDFEAIEITESNPCPDLGRNDIVLASSVLEYVRNPLKLVQNMDCSIPSGGFLWTSGYPMMEEPEVGAERLPEGNELRARVLHYLEDHFELVTLPSLPGFLYRKPRI